MTRRCVCVSVRFFSSLVNSLFLWISFFVRLGPTCVYCVPFLLFNSPIDVTLFPFCPFARNKFISESSAFGAKFCKNRRLSKWNWRQHKTNNTESTYLSHSFLGGIGCHLYALNGLVFCSAMTKILSVSSDFMNWFSNQMQKESQNRRLIDFVCAFVSLIDWSQSECRCFVHRLCSHARTHFRFVLLYELRAQQNRKDKNSAEHMNANSTYSSAWNMNCYHYHDMILILIDSESKKTMFFFCFRSDWLAFHIVRLFSAMFSFRLSLLSAVYSFAPFQFETNVRSKEDYQSSRIEKNPYNSDCNISVWLCLASIKRRQANIKWNCSLSV